MHRCDCGQSIGSLTLTIIRQMLLAARGEIKRNEKFKIVLFSPSSLFQEINVCWLPLSSSPTNNTGRIPSRICGNHGDCHSLPGGNFSCTCHKGYTGARCHDGMLRPHETRSYRILRSRALEPLSTKAMALMQDDVKLLLFLLLTTKPRFDVKGNLTPKRGLVLKTKE